MNGPRLWFVVWCAGFVWSMIGATDQFTWALEVFPAVLGLLALALTRRKYPLTLLAYVLVLVHSYVLFIGGHYTYAEVPLGFWIRDAFGLARNHYDRIGHFAQGLRRCAPAPPSTVTTWWSSPAGRTRVISAFLRDIRVHHLSLSIYRTV